MRPLGWAAAGRWLASDMRQIVQPLQLLTLLAARPPCACRLQKQAVFEAFDFAELRGEVAAVEAAAAAFDSPIAFCHNDLLSGQSLRGTEPATVAMLGW